MADLASLLNALRRGEMPGLGPGDVDHLTGWLCGATARSDATADLPRPDHDPVLQQMVFFRLDTTLFNGGQLRLDAAGLSPDQPAARRKTRFRRLASAFHPDRNPAMAEWLTARSQIILTAYARFKSNPVDSAEPASTPHRPDPEPDKAATDAYGRSPRRAPGGFRRALLALRRRFGPDRFLAHKLIALLALIALLPVLNLWLAPDTTSPGTDFEPAQAPAASAAVNGPSELASGQDRPGTVPNRAEKSADAPTGAEGPSALRRAARQAMTLSQQPVTTETPLTSVDVQLEALGLATDQERLYRRMARANAPSEPARNTSSEPAAPARIGKDERPATLGQRSMDVQAQSSTAPPAAARGIGNEAGDEAGNEPINEPATAAAMPNGNNRESGFAALVTPDRRPEPAASTPHAPSVSVADSSPKPARAAAETIAPEPRLGPGELRLGPLTSSAPGEVLAGFKQDLEHGNLIGIASRFAPDVRHGRLRGLSAVTDHYRALFDRYPRRRVDLRARRMQRDGERWRIEVELVITGVRDGALESVRDGSAQFVIGPHGDRIGILRMDS